MHRTELLNHLLVLLCLIPTVLCTEGTTVKSNISDEAEETTLTINIENIKSEGTTIQSNLPVEGEKAAVKPNIIVEDIDPTTTDVCSMSLVSLSEQDGMKHEKCRCNSLNEYVDCKYLQITELPKLISFPKSARSVTFQGNKIANLAEDVFYNGRRVLQLDISHNRIDFISTQTFLAFKSLKHLDLSHNKIWNMPENSFQGLTELQHINLGYNDIISISANLFAMTSNLKELNLECNPLQDLEPKLFEHLPKLEVLDLESTLLKVLPDHIFIFTPHLRRLDISSNQLNEVPTDALKVLDNLKWLDLSGNPISSIPSEAFVGMRGLVVLYLNRMPLLTEIEKYAFGDLQQLHELHCSYNFLLSEIDENAFVRKVDNKKVPLSQLFLRQDALRFISKDLLSWNDEVELHIENNQLSCDCNTQWMVTLKLKNEFQSHVRCSSPSHLEGVAISQLKDHDLSCGLELSEILLITCSVIVAIFIFALIIAFVIWRRNYAGYSKPYFKKQNVEDIDYRGDDDI